MFDIREANFALELWGVAFCAIGIVCALLLVRTERSYRNLLVAMFSFELLASAGDAISIASAHHVSVLAKTLALVGNSATYICSFLLQAAVTLYLCMRIVEVGGPSYRPWRIGVCIAAAVMSVLAACGMFFGFDEGNVYYRKDGYVLSVVFVGVVSLANAALVLLNRKRLETAGFVCLLFYTLAPLVASAIQSAVYGPNLAIAVGVLGLVVVFFELQVHSSRMLVERSEALARAQEQAAQDRIAVMVSQIQPHFLFNTLDTIYGLVQEDTAAAGEAIASFSRYLRTNLASLNQTTPVPVERELEHVRTYLELERASDPERMGFELDVKATGFSVPALSIQTLAENAVRHGIGAKLEGGTVRVVTREEGDEYLVDVIDDGVGFAVGECGQAEGEHVGLENTRSRLAAMCGGTLAVSSELGAGTRVVMHIPKREA